MAEITDLGYGYGKLDKYHSEYASLIFPLCPRSIMRLYDDGYLNRDETTHMLLGIGYSQEQAKLLIDIRDALATR